MLVKGEHGRRCSRGGPPVCEEHALEREHIGRRVGVWSGVKPNTWTPRCNPGRVSSPAWSRQGFFRASPCPARKDSSSKAPSSSTLTPQSATCEPWRRQAPHATCLTVHMRRRRNMEHAIPLSGPFSHILTSSFCHLCISTMLLLGSGHVWLAVLAVCRRPAAYSSVGQLGRESEAWDVQRGSLGKSVSHMVCLRRRGERRRPCFVGYSTCLIR
jgi:hypothetical protein